MMADSRDLLEIPREHYCSDARLWIESAPLSEALMIIGGFIVALAATFLTARLGPPTIDTQKAERLFTNMTHNQYRFSAYPISGYNRFVRFELSFLRASQSSTMTTVAFSYQVDCFSQALPVKTFRKRVANLGLPSGNDRNDTLKFRLFDDKFVNYEAAELQLNLSTPDLDSCSGLTVFTSLGTPNHTTYQAYFRFLYSAVEFAGVLLLCWQPGMRKLSTWTQELYLTFFLLFIAILSNNPLYIRHALRTSLVFWLIEALAPAAFHAYSILLCMHMVDFVVNKNVKSSAFKLRWWDFVAISLFACEFTKSIILMSSYELSSVSRFCRYLGYGQILAHALFLAFGLYFVVGLGPGVDVTERGKFWAYSLALGIVMGHSLIVVILGRTFRLFEGTEAEWIGAFGVYNTFTLMVMYFHWPFIPAKTYQESGSSPAFVN
jgi:hypothetical protein